jgi:hypothetical protein
MKMGKERREREKARLRRGSYRIPLEGESREEERDSSGAVMGFSHFLFYIISVAVKCRNTGKKYFF